MNEPTNPLDLFTTIYAEAMQLDVAEPNAVCLATADAAGRPSARMVLLKGSDARGFVFYTNLRSRKAHDLEVNPSAALCFYWPQLGRQIRIEGSVEQVSDTEADAYFASRARGSQIGAWASHQSSELSSRDELVARVEETERHYAGRDVPRPEHWSGFRLLPRRIEFWSAGEHRLHDREVYETEDGSTWRMHRLYP